MIIEYFFEPYQTPYRLHVVNILCVNRMSKTVSSRLPKEIHERLHECCNNKGITINDFVKEAVENKLNGSDPTNNQFQNCTECGEDSHEIYKKVFETIHDADGNSYNIDDKGRLLNFNVEWSYDE